MEKSNKILFKSYVVLACYSCKIRTYRHKLYFYSNFRVATLCSQYLRETN